MIAIGAQDGKRNARLERAAHYQADQDHEEGGKSPENNHRQNSMSFIVGGIVTLDALLGRIVRNLSYLRFNIN